MSEELLQHDLIEEQKAHKADSDALAEAQKTIKSEAERATKAEAEAQALKTKSGELPDFDEALAHYSTCTGPNCKPKLDAFVKGIITKAYDKMPAALVEKKAKDLKLIPDHIQLVVPGAKK